MSTEIKDLCDLLTEKIATSDPKKFSPDVLTSIRNLHTKVEDVLTGEEEKLKCFSIEKLLSNETDQLKTRTRNCLNYIGIVSVWDLKERFSVCLANGRKKIKKYKFYEYGDSFYKIKNFGLACHQVLIKALREKSFIDADGIWLV